MPGPGEAVFGPLNFDPLVRLHPRQRHGNLAWIPNGDKAPVRLIRWYPSEGNPKTRDRLQSADEAITRIKHRERHLAMLTTIGGIVVPRHASFVGMEKTGDDPAMTIYTAIDNVAFPQPLTALSSPGGNELHSTLAKYYSWVVTTQEPVIFGEIFHPSQFCLTNGGQNDERHITLLDVDCRQMQTNDVNLASVRARLAQLKQSFDGRSFLTP